MTNGQRLCDLRLSQNLRSVLAGSPYKRMQEERPLFLSASVVKKREDKKNEELQMKSDE